MCLENVFHQSKYAINMYVRISGWLIHCILCDIIFIIHLKDQPNLSWFCGLTHKIAVCDF